MKEKVLLKDIASFSKGSQINGDDLLATGIYDYINGGILPSGKWNDYNTEGNTVTISEGGNSCGFVNYMEKPFWCGAHCYYLYDAPKNSRYFYYALKSKQDNLMNLRSGACMPNIKKNDLGNFELIFDFDEKNQSQIVTVLDMLASLKRHRIQQLDALNSLVQSRFVEMFGDPVKNPMKWDQSELNSVCSKITDGEHGSVKKVEQGVAFLNAKHIRKNGCIDWSTTTYISKEVHEKIYKRCNPEKNDLLLTTTGTIGNVAIVQTDEEFSMDRGITLLKLDQNKMESIFLAECLRQGSIQHIMDANVHASAIGHLFLNKVKALPIIIVPLELQQKFVSFVTQIDKSKVVIQKSIEKLQLLFDSLMQQYFG